MLLVPAAVQAQNTTVNLTQLTAQGVAIYGWKNGTPTVLYTKKANYLFPVASITKLVTAKAVEELYPESENFTISKEAMTNTEEIDTDGIVPGMTFSRDDMLRAMLISSINGAANQFDESSPTGVFLNAMNSFLHTNGYTKTNFVNPSGLDPTNKNIAPNSLTPQSVTYLLQNIFTTDPLLTSILETKAVTITDKTSGKVLQLTSSNGLNYDPDYSFYIILSKTGTTDLAGQNVAFITNGGTKFDYITVVLMHSKNRVTDGEIAINWLQKVLVN
jgi:D-alanyl-D-alanine endopeptidase (penicillin-binding protein 7)